MSFEIFVMLVDIISGDVKGVQQQKWRILYADLLRLMIGIEQGQPRYQAFAGTHTTSRIFHTNFMTYL